MNFIKLNEGEEIIHIGQKSFFEFITFFVLLLVATCYIAYVPIQLLRPHFEYLINNPDSGRLIALFLWYLFVGFLIFQCLKYVRDYFFTDIILTNKRFIIKKIKDTFSYDYCDIPYIERLTGAGKGPSGIFVVTNDREFIISFLNATLIKEKIEELYPNKQYVLPNPQKQIKRVGIIFLILILLSIISKYL